MKNNIKTQKGITLIALVITIVVMLILAGISINLIIGENGIFTKTKEAREKFESSTVKEQLEMDMLSTEIGEPIESTVYDYVQGLKGVEVINRLPYNRESKEVTASTTEAAVVVDNEVYAVILDTANTIRIEREENENTLMQDITGNVEDTWLSTNIKRKQIKTIQFENTNVVPEGKDSVDVTLEGYTPGTVMCWWDVAETIEGIDYFNMYIGAVGGVMAPRNCMHLFATMSAVTQISFTETENEMEISNFNTSNVINIGGMFSQCRALETLNLGSKFITSKVNNMRYMFCSLEKLETLNLGGNFDTSNVTDMEAMFANMFELTSLDLGDKFNTKNVINMNSTFYSMKNLTSLDLGNYFDTSKVDTMSYMFCSNYKLTSLDLGDKFDTSKVTNIRSMFADLYDMISLNLGDKFVSNSVINMNTMFQSVYNISYLNLGNLGVTRQGELTTLNMFNNIKAGCVVTVKNEAVKTWLTGGETPIYSGTVNVAE